MDIMATLHVTAVDARRKQTPAPERIIDAVMRLSRLGFRVQGFGKYGVFVNVDDAVFERMLGLPVPGPQGCSTPMQPCERSLVGVVDRVEVAAR